MAPELAEAAWGGYDPLSERAVLRLAEEGRGDMEIIDALSLSHGTVHHYLHEAAGKLGATTALRQHALRGRPAGCGQHEQIKVKCGRRHTAIALLAEAAAVDRCAASGRRAQRAPGAESASARSTMANDRNRCTAVPRERMRRGTAARPPVFVYARSATAPPR